MRFICVGDAPLMTLLDTQSGPSQFQCFTDKESGTTEDCYPGGRLVCESLDPVYGRKLLELLNESADSFPVTKGVLA